MWANLQKTADLVTFSKDFTNSKWKTSCLYSVVKIFSTLETLLEEFWENKLKTGKFY